MKMIRLFIIVVLVLLILLSIPVPSFACSCAESLSVENEYTRSVAVFRGEVIGVKEVDHSKRVMIEVLENWKGANQSQIIIQTGLGDGDCGIDFEMGKEYLVYANKQSVYDDSGNYFSTGICDRTTSIHAVTNDFDILGQGMAPTKKVDLEEEFNRVFPKWLLSVVVVFVACLGIAGVFAIWNSKRKAK
jgi:hypothetical protein